MQSAFVSANTLAICLSHRKQAAAALKQFDKVIKIGPNEFSWFIYRITIPALRDLFISPSNIFHVKEGVLSVLAGDVFGPTNIRGPLRIFRTFYYINSLLNFRRTFKAWKMRKSTIRFVDKVIMVKQKTKVR